MNTGCFSLMAYKANQRNIYEKYAYKINEPQAIKAFLAGNYVGVGIDLTAGDAIFDSWSSLSKQIAGLAADSGITYGLYLGAKELLNNNNSEDKPQTVTATDGNVYYVSQSGDNNTVTIQSSDK